MTHYFPETVNLSRVAGGRRDIINEFGFGFPFCSENIELIQSYSPIVEIGSGTGALAAHIQQNCKIVATDIGNKNYKFEVGKFFPTQKMSDVQAVLKYPKYNVLCCWPNYSSSWAATAIAEIKIGRHLIYIGEGSGGCCADYDFFELLDKDFKLITESPKPRWFGIYDNVYVYKRITRSK